jgi:hypothetical protein
MCRRGAVGSIIVVCLLQAHSLLELRVPPWLSVIMPFCLGYGVMFSGHV